MGTIVTGKFLGSRTRNVEHNGNSWIETEWVLLEGVETETVRLGKDFSSDQPAEGDQVAVEVAMNAWKSRAGNVGIQLTALRRVAILEKTLRGGSTPAIPAQRSA